MVKNNPAQDNLQTLSQYPFPQVHFKRVNDLQAAIQNQDEVGWLKRIKTKEMLKSLGKQVLSVANQATLTSSSAEEIQYLAHRAVTVIQGNDFKQIQSERLTAFSEFNC